MVNNLVYAMTGGQASPVTPRYLSSIVSFKSCIPENTLDICRLVADAGAVYVARWSTIHVNQLKKAFMEAIEMKGFRFIEVIAQCTSRISERLGQTPISYLRNLIKHMRPVSSTRKYDSTIIPVGEYAKRR